MSLCRNTTLSPWLAPHHHLCVWESPYRGFWFRGLGRSWGGSSLGGSAGRRMCLSLAVEGRELAGEAWGAACPIGVCCHKLWLWFLSQQWWRHWRLPAALRRTLPGASSPSYQVGSCQGAHPLFPLLVCLLFPRRLLVLCPCALQDTLESPQLWLLSAAPLFWCPSQHRRGQGSARWLLGCLGCTLLRSHAGHHQAGCLLASRRRSGFTALPDWGPWQVHGSLLLWERRPGLALPHPP